MRADMAYKISDKKRCISALSGRWEDIHNNFYVITPVNDYSENPNVRHTPNIQVDS